MNAAEARAATEAARDAAEAGLQARVAKYRAKATPEALLEATERGRRSAVGERELLDKHVATAVAKGEREVRNYSAHHGAMISEFDAVGVAYMTAYGEALRDLLVADGFTVRYDATRFVSSGWRTQDAPKGIDLTTFPPGEVRAEPRTFEWLVGATFTISW